MNLPPNPPNQFRLFRRTFIGGKHHGIGTAQRPSRLPQSSEWQQGAGKIGVRKHHDIEIAMQTTMLEAVVQKMQLAWQFFFCQQSCLVTVCAHNNRHAQFARDQQRLIAKLFRSA